MSLTDCKRFQRGGDDSKASEEEARSGSDDEDAEESEEEGATNDNAFVYTSNVDTMFTQAGFGEDGVGVYEIHGDILSWQCSKGEACSSHTWQVPRSTRFEVSKKTMRAKARRSEPALRVAPPKVVAKQSPTWTDSEDGSDGSDEDGKQKTDGDVCRDGKWAAAVEQEAAAVPEQGPNHPRCQRCSARARPNILMFDDGFWTGNPPEQKVYSRWWKSHRKRLKANKQLKFVVLEIGAGVRIPTVRNNSEKLMKKLPMGQGRLIRINPDFELADSSHGAVSTSIIPIKEGALSALVKIDAAMVEIQKAEAEESAAVEAAKAGRRTPATEAWQRAEGALRRAAAAKALAERTKERSAFR